jgi:membrane-associated phospholipid phosphatase
MIILLLITSLDWRLGGSVVLVFLVTVGIEQIIKAIFDRQRPFSSHAEIRMLQPTHPHDPSFPSGDALRIWYLVLLLPAATGQAETFLAVLLLLALLVTTGRMVMGVHYLTDAISGTGLGILGAGTTIWLWGIFNLL